jgi:hypothetical protein
MPAVNCSVPYPEPATSQSVKVGYTLVTLPRIVTPYRDSVDGTRGSVNKDKAIPLQAWTGPEGSRRLRFPDFKTIGT